MPQLTDKTEVVFMCFFIVEIMVRCIALGRYFWRSRWNIFDSIVVLFSLLEYSTNIQMGLDPKFVRILRLGKIVRFIRMLRFVSFMDPLVLLLRSIVTNLYALLWGMVLLGTVQFVAGLVLVQLLNQYLMDDGEPVSERSAVYEYFGTFSRGMITMFEVTHTNFAKSMMVLMANVNESVGWFVISYRVLISFAIMSVIQSIFIQQTMEVAQLAKSPDMLVRANRRREVAHSRRLDFVFSRLDTQNEGFVTREQFKANPDAWECIMGCLDVPARDSDMFFDIIDADGSGSVTKSEFVAAAIRLQGAAKAIDVTSLSQKVDQLQSSISKLIRDGLVSNRGDPETDQGDRETAHTSVVTYYGI